MTTERDEPSFDITQPGQYTVVEIAERVARHPEDLVAIQQAEARSKNRKAVAEMVLPQDTLPEWLYNRARRQAENDLPWKPWAQQNYGVRTYWEHEAAAVRRAVIRNGFKDYDPQMSNK